MTRERKWQAISGWVDATAFCYAYNSPFDTERRRRVPNVNEPFSFSVEEFVWVPISFTDDVNSERCALCGVFPSRFEDDDDVDDDEEEAAEVECLINLLFIVVRSSSSDTKHQLCRVTSDVCILISYSTLFYLCHGTFLSDSLQLTFRRLPTFETTHYVRMALWPGSACLHLRSVGPSCAVGCFRTLIREHEFVAAIKRLWLRCLAVFLMKW